MPDEQCDLVTDIVTAQCAGELYPTEVRTTAHGISAGVAKLGALWATIWFNYEPLLVSRSVMLHDAQRVMTPPPSPFSSLCRNLRLRT